MPYLETPEELADHLADGFYIYGGCTKADDDWRAECKGCRICWKEQMTERIRQAVANERQLQAKVSDR